MKWGQRSIVFQDVTSPVGSVWGLRDRERARCRSKAPPTLALDQRRVGGANTWPEISPAPETQADNDMLDQDPP